MSLSQPLPELRKSIKEILIEDLPAAIKALRELLPEGSEKHSMILAMLAQINDANKAHFRNTLSPEEYARKIDSVRANFLDLLDALEAADFEEPLAGGSSKKTGARTGSVLYRVPHRMPLRKPVICTVRVAMDEDALLEDIVLDADVRVKQRVEVSDMMKAELLDPEGNVFQVRSLSEATQLVRETGKTQWLFSVTPLIEGQHQLLVKVSMMEFVPNLGAYVPREVSILETITIVTEGVMTDEAEAPLKNSGVSFQPHPGPPRKGGSTVLDDFEVESTKALDDKIFNPPPPAPVVLPPPAQVVLPEKSINPDPTDHHPAPQQSRPISGRVRALSFLLLFLIVASTGTYALTPPPVRDFWIAELSGSADAYAAYIEAYKDNPAAQPRVEKAYYRKALKTETIEDLRAYQEVYAEKGLYRQQVAEKIRTLEMREVESIRRQPTGARIRRFLKNYPESTELGTVATAAATDEQVLQEVQPELNAAIEQKAETATTTEEVKALMPVLRAVASTATVERVEQIVSRKTQVRKEVKDQFQELKTAVKARENDKTSDAGQEQPNPSLSDKIETRKTENATQTDGNTSLKEKIGDRLSNKKEAIAEKIEARKDPDATPSLSERAGEGLKAIADGMVLIKGGTFTMGCLDGRDKNCSESEKPSHTVTLNDFYLSRTEVTQAQWEAVMGNNPSNFKNCPTCPVEQVSWDDVQGFIKKLNDLTGQQYSLPSEAEWEYAARGGANSKGYEYAGSNDPGEVAWYGSNSGTKTHPVAQKKKNELGLFDMSGNVYEWCQDVWHEDYQGAPSRGNAWMTGGEQARRVVRGGSWLISIGNCRVSNRDSNGNADDRNNVIGFRLAR